ncbi:unnamed protein product [Clavelina lepadiformis]|uniref:TMEM248/TMEM219 domain-containing protein n=1 Tax=Clavelina lepadiformis TaxID=159417 RepID=A0ABP0GAC0_CLALP
MTSGSLNRVRVFLSSRPPLVVFIFCIGMTTVAFISFAYYVKLNNVRNPDVARDWNTFLYNATQINFCNEPQNYSSLQLNVTHFTHGTQPLYKNVSTHLETTIFMPAKNVDELVSSMSSTIHASLLGFSGFASNLSLFVLFDFYEPLNLRCDNSAGCVKDIAACTNIFAPAILFPPALQLPACSAQMNRSHTSSIRLIGELPRSDFTSSDCHLLVKINHDEDEKLVVMLNLETRLMVHSHLMVSSYIFIAVIIVVTLLGLLRSGSREHHNKYSHNSLNQL